MEPQITARNWIQILALGLVWGATFLVMELALRGIGPAWLAAGRIGFAGLLTLAIWWLRGARLFLGDATDWGTLAICGLLSTALPFMLLTFGLQHVTSGFAGVSMAAVVLMVLPLAHFLIPGEKMTLRRTLGFVIGFAGILVLIGPGAFAASGAEGEVLGRLACLAAASCYAISSVLLRRLPAIDPLGLTAMTFVIGSALVLPAAWLMEGPPPRTDAITLFWVVVLGMIPTAAANLLRILVIRSAGPVFMGLVNYMVPVASVLLGALILSEPLPPGLLSAMMLILAGMGLSQYGALSRLFRRRPLP
ncbi:DMT family transporter [Mesobacterium sp. TK19101]|uniref:DMT family transporter n=1 Tax=Mesobacterium hydrothermale TaxID=3111907 RepID=A0ABU6HFY9_9RHOB|nr:DMT family transporter [Mesobacterium sp. TK19101]MEC3861042.1 DMT family transporter [Mesobacterium sp. TK19101]